MIRLTTPSSNDLDAVMHLASTAHPTFPAEGTFNDFAFDEVVGHGQADFEAAGSVLRQWAMHTGAGVRVEPVPLVVGNDVVLWTRVLGLSLVFACRITELVDTDSIFGFTYATLPGHPEQGVETFHVVLLDDQVRLRITGESRPALLLNKLSGPVGPIMQKRFTRKYVAAMRSGIRNTAASS